MLAVYLLLTFLTTQAKAEDPNPLCCFAEQVKTGNDACKNDPFCSPLCQQGSSFECNTASHDRHPDIECQNCGCCPCCATGEACCKGGSVDSNLSPEDQEMQRAQADLSRPAKVRSFRVEVTQYGQSPDFQKGVCRPVCTKNCYGHGTCTPLPPGSCPASTCKCEPGFNPTLSCSTCKSNNFGKNCTECPAVTSTGKTCSGHGECDGAGTTSGTGACTCETGFAPEVGSGKECSTCVSTNFGPTCQSCPSVSKDNKVCSGHGLCDGAGTLSGTGKCTCNTGFDVTDNCENCLKLHWGSKCSLCPGVVSPGTSGAVACSGHGACSGDGTKQKGDGKCTCKYGWELEDCSQLYCPKGCLHGTCVTDDNLNPRCECEHGWHSETCSVPQCPTPLAPGVPGCVHGNCSTTQLEHCDCEPGWGDSRCSTPICTQGCIIGKGECVAPQDCKCAKGYSGPDCGTAVCEAPCVEDQGDCTSPNHCTCRPDFQGNQCEVNNAACCFSTSCGDAPTSCGVCCQYERGHRVPGTQIVGCRGDRYTCRNCDCDICCIDGGYCSMNKTDIAVLDILSSSSSSSSSLSSSSSSSSLVVEKVESPPTPKNVGKCCDGHREGSSCSRCVSGYFGSECDACPGSNKREKESEAPIVCSGHGQCDEGIHGNGTCSCENGYYGVDCHTCDDSFCPMHCSGHGTCDCAKVGSTPKCDCINGWGGETLEGIDDSCHQCTRGFSDVTNCSSCSSGWYGGDSMVEEGRLVCQECDCDAKYCDDGNNGTGRCTHPPTPGSAPSPAGGPGSIPIIVFVAAGCGVIFIGCIVIFVGRSKKRTNLQQRQEASRTATVNEPLLQAPIGVGGYRPMSKTEEETSQQKSMMQGSDAFATGGDADGESLEERLARMARET